MQMAMYVLSQLSSCYRVGPIPSHNLSGQMLKLVEKVYSSLCPPSLGLDSRQPLFLRKERNCLDKNNFTEINKFYFIYEKMVITVEWFPLSVYSMNHLPYRAGRSFSKKRR